MAGSPKRFWPTTIYDMFVLQFRIALTLVILLTAAVHYRLGSDEPSFDLFLGFCYLPTILLIFAVNRKTLLWTSFLILCSAVGAVSGYILGLAIDASNGMVIFIAAITATLAWWLAVNFKRWKIENAKLTKNSE